MISTQIDPKDGRIRIIKRNDVDGSSINHLVLTIEEEEKTITDLEYLVRYYYDSVREEMSKGLLKKKKIKVVNPHNGLEAYFIGYPGIPNRLSRHQAYRLKKKLFINEYYQNLTVITTTEDQDQITHIYQDALDKKELGIKEK